MKKQKKQSPRNYRIITDLPAMLAHVLQAGRFKKVSKKSPKLLERLKIEALVFLYVVTIFSILILAFNLFTNLQRQKEINFQREKIQSEIKLWQDVADKFKNYKEAYYQLAVLEYELGEIEKAKFYISKSLYLDPNFDKAKELKKILNTY